MKVWRIVSSEFAETAFDGEGARTGGGRWNPRGVPVAYASQSAALCVLEAVANLEMMPLLNDYRLIPVAVEDARIENVSADDLPAGWAEDLELTRAIGGRWIEELRSVALRVPSVLVPVEHNLLINPAHPDFQELLPEPPLPFSFDARLFR